MMMVILATRSISTTRRRRKVARTSMLGLTPLAITLVIWQIFGDPTSPIFPPPSEWWVGWTELWATGRVAPAFTATLVTFAVSLLIATVIGTCLGGLVGSSPMADRAATPMLQLLMSVPPPTVVPVFILVLGVGFDAQVACVVFAAVWPVLLNVASAMRSIPAVRLEAARTMNLSWLRRLRAVVVPSLIPGISIGVMIAAPMCIVVTLLVEMLTSAPGAGSLILQSQRSFQSAQVYALVVAIGILGLLVNQVIAVAETLLTRRWPTAGA